MPKANPGCYNCARRRIACDQTRPRCNKCLRKGIDCPGYGVRYRFNDGIASRGKLTGCLMPFDIDGGASTLKNAELGSVSTLLWPDGTTTSSRATNESGAKLLLSTGRCSVSNGVKVQQPHRHHYTPGRVVIHENQPDQRGLYRPEEQSNLALLRGGHLSTLEFNSVPRPLVLINWHTQKLFAHFSSVIAPVMVILDGKFNGYRDLILPLAHGDDLVQAAVRVVSQYHLSSQQPELQTHADQGLQAIIGRLRQRTLLRGDLLDHSAWATVIILLAGETATGNNNFPYLFKILQHLGHANMQADMHSVLHAFLTEQTRMMTLFAQPLLGENSGIVTLRTRPERYFDFITNTAIFNPHLQAMIDTYKSAIHRACNMYLVRAIQGPPHSETTAEVEALRVLCEQIDPNAPGHHALVWVYFIAAAESSTFADRNFFTMRLQEIFSRTHFHNIPTALNALQELWKAQEKRKWTEALPEIMPVFII